MAESDLTIEFIALQNAGDDLGLLVHEKFGFGTLTF
jgi:hypothetical protein